MNIEFLGIGVAQREFVDLLRGPAMQAAFLQRWVLPESPAVAVGPACL
jgi:hypothetical protein